jgi:hypothetical protein
MVYYISGFILAALIREMTPKSRALPTPCFAGTAMLVDVMFIYRMTLVLSLTPTIIAIRRHGNRIPAKA